MIGVDMMVGVIFGVAVGLGVGDGEITEGVDVVENKESNLCNDGSYTAYVDAPAITKHVIMINHFFFCPDST